MPEKIPIELLLKYSRQEVGTLKSDIDELKYIIEQKDKEIQKLTAKVKSLQKLNHHRSPSVQVQDELESLTKQYDKITGQFVLRREKKLITLYKRSARTYNYWFEGCKKLLPFLQKLRTTSFDSTP